MQRRRIDFYSALWALCLLLLLPAVSAYEAGAYDNPLVTQERDVFRIVYSVEGPEAVPDTDSNGNGIPDSIEDMATQLSAARDVFARMGFPDPLRSQRYAGVSGIMVIVRARSSMQRLHGRAFSRASGSRLFPGKWLKIHISSDTDPRRNSTPAHEYFHLIQYAQSRFMNGWYLEGMARWAEDAIRKVHVDPISKIDMKTPYCAKYTAAEQFWHPLGVTCGGSVLIPSSVVNRYKYVDGTPVFKDDVINGPEAMRKVLACLHTKEIEAAESFGGLTTWRRDGQLTPLNTPFILECVRETQNQCIRETPLRSPSERY
ncbi:MAG: hypothetical protein J5861_08085 [Desulfovibrio sp.]|nr:hypothetical protein [Desulfovibrio sp.]